MVSMAPRSPAHRTPVARQLAWPYDWSEWMSTDGELVVASIPDEELKALRLNQQQYARFVAKIERAVIREEYGECHVWTGATTEKGYGKFYVGKRPDGRPDVRLAHRVSFEHHTGEVILPGFIVDHECSHKGCVRKEHLKQVSMVENLRLAHERRPWKRRNQYSTD